MCLIESLPTPVVRLSTLVPSSSSRGVPPKLRMRVSMSFSAANAIPPNMLALVAAASSELREGLSLFMCCATWILPIVVMVDMANM